jgi:hypothetical protein
MLNSEGRYPSQIKDVDNKRDNKNDGVTTIEGMSTTTGPQQKQKGKKQLEC